MRSQTQSTHVAPLVNAAVDHDCRPSLRCLMPDDRRQIPPRFGDQVATQLKHEPRRCGALDQSSQFSADGCQIEFCIIAAVGNAETATGG